MHRSVCCDVNLEQYPAVKKKKKWLHVLTHSLTTAPLVFFCSCVTGEHVRAPLVPCSTIKEVISQTKKKRYE